PPDSYFSISLHAYHPPTHSFPTRRSSDLLQDAVQRRHRPEPEHQPPPPGGAAAEQVEADPHDAVHAQVDHRRAHQRRHVTGCLRDRKSTRLNSSHVAISYAVFCLKKKKKN